jgi:hypothetical protein
MSPSQPFPRRLAHSALKLALRFWPEESLEWGQALAAELDEIEKPLVVLTWAFGGLMLFTRASVAHLWSWLKLPAGARLSTTSLPLGTTPPILPKRSRLFTAMVLIVTAAVLVLPQSREAISTVRESWTGYQASSSDLRTLEKLAARAEKQKDARTLAFVALNLPDRERAIILADRAVALDPTLAWIYASRVDSRNFSQLTKERVARLLTSDPNNAFAQLIAVQSVYVPRYTALLSRHTPTDRETEAAVTGDPDWAARMVLAFRAPRYDSYFDRNWRLTQEVWNHEPSFSAPLIVGSLWIHSFPDILSIKTYSNRLMRSAQEASSAGDAQRAQSLIFQVDAFGRLMTDQGERDFERLYGLHLSEQATKALQDLYLRTGDSKQAVTAANRLQQIETQSNTLVHSFRDAKPSLTRALERKAFLVQFSAVFAVLLALATVFGLLALELRRERSSKRFPRLGQAICLAVDWAPIALLASFIALLWAFQPFANILRSARSVESASAAWHTMHFQGLFLLSNILDPLFDPMTAYNFWLSFLCALVALALFLIARGFLRHKQA